MSNSSKAAGSRISRQSCTRSSTKQGNVQVRGWTSVPDLFGNDEACSTFQNADSRPLSEVLDYLWVPSAEEMSLDKLLQPCTSQEGLGSAPVPDALHQQIAAPLQQRTADVPMQATSFPAAGPPQQQGTMLPAVQPQLPSSASMPPPMSAAQPQQSAAVQPPPCYPPVQGVHGPTHIRLSHQSAEAFNQAVDCSNGVSDPAQDAAGAAEPNTARSHASAAASRQMQQNRRDLLPERAKERAQRKARKERATQAVEERVQLRQHINDLESRLQMMSMQFAQANAQSAEANRQLNIQALQQRALEQQKHSTNHISVRSHGDNLSVVIAGPKFVPPPHWGVNTREQQSASSGTPAETHGSAAAWVDCDQNQDEE